MQGNEKKISEAKFKGYMCYMWVNGFVNGAPLCFQEEELLS